MAAYGPGWNPQNSIWTEAKLRFICYFVGDRPVHKLPFDPKCHELFVILYSILANLSDDMFFVIVYLRQKNEFGQNPEENIIFIGSGQYYTFIACWWRKYENVFTQEHHIPCGQRPRGIWYSWVNTKRLLHDIFHIGPGISPRLLYQARQRSWRSDMGRGLIPGTIWKISCHNLYITYFTLTFSKHWLLYCKTDLWTDKLRK
jgi:hypothetical protein